MTSCWAPGALNRRERRQLARDIDAAASAAAVAPASAPTTAAAGPLASLSLPLTLPPAPSLAAATTAPVQASLQSSSSYSVLKTNTDELWRAASALAAGGVESLANKFMPAMLLQKDITAALEQQLHEKLLTELGVYQQAIVSSLSAAPQSGAFLTVLPTERAYRLSDEQMRLAVRHRLGMLPALSLRADSCLSCHARNTVHQPEFVADPGHFEACIGRAPAGASVTSRHHRIAGVLAGLARSVGYTVVREPPFGSVVATSSAVDPDTGAPFDVDDVFTDSARGDLLLLRGDERLLVDVTVVRPTAPTHLRNARLAVATKGLACAAAAERAKRAKYGALCAERGWKMCAFALESYGALGQSARKLLHTLASKADEVSAAAFLQHACASLSVALQAANAAIAVGGLQRLRLEQLSADLPMSPGQGGCPSRRRTARRVAHVHASQLDVSSAFHGGFHAADRAAAAVFAA